MEQKRNPEIYFHMGLERTGTTFLQQSVFPNLGDIYYVPKSQYKNIVEIIKNSNCNKFLLTHESKALFQEIKKFSAKYPDARIILVFRRHDKWIASHFKREIKNGYSKNFNDFIDLENDTGTWKKEDLYYFPKVKFIEECFNKPPLILFQDELKSSPEDFVRKILKYTGAKEASPIPYKAQHTSYSNKELKFRHWVTQNTIFKRIEVKNRKFPLIRRFYNKFVRYASLYIAKLIPNKWMGAEPLIPEEELKRIREFYGDDWEKVKEYAHNNNPVS